MKSRLTKVLALVDSKLDRDSSCMEAQMLDRLQLKDNGCKMPGPCSNCGYRGAKWLEGLKLCLD